MPRAQTGRILPGLHPGLVGTDPRSQRNFDFFLEHKIVKVMRAMNKKTWLFGVYRGFYFSVIWGLY